MKFVLKTPIDAISWDMDGPTEPAKWLDDCIAKQPGTLGSIWLTDGGWMMQGLDAVHPINPGDWVVFDGAPRVLSAAKFREHFKVAK